MQKPTSIRIPQALRSRLSRAAKNSNVPATEIMLIGLARFLDDHRSAGQIIDAVVRSRQQAAKATP